MEDVTISYKESEALIWLPSRMALRAALSELSPDDEQFVDQLCSELDVETWRPFTEWHLRRHMPGQLDGAVVRMYKYNDGSYGLDLTSSSDRSRDRVVEAELAEKLGMERGLERITITLEYAKPTTPEFTIDFGPIMDRLAGLPLLHDNATTLVAEMVANSRKHPMMTEVAGPTAVLARGKRPILLELDIDSIENTFFSPLSAQGTTLSGKARPERGRPRERIAPRASITLLSYRLETAHRKLDPTPVFDRAEKAHMRQQMADIRTRLEA